MTPTPDYDDKTLSSLLKKGDRNAFTAIYNRYWEKLYFLAYSHLKSEAVSEEIVQDVFLTLWRRKDQLNIESLQFYLAAMTRHAVYRKLARDKKKTDAEAKAALHTADINAPQQHIDNKNILEIVRKLAEALPEKCRLVFIHNKLLDKSIEEVSEILNISPKTAEAHLTKALKIVRDKLKGII